MRDPLKKQSSVDLSFLWAADWVLRCYPYAWRERYRDEMIEIFQHYPVTIWTLIDLFVGAFDAHLHPTLLPRRIMTMAYRIRTSEIVIFCAFVVYGIAWFAVRFVRDPIPLWERIVAVHPEIRVALMAVDSAGLIALLAIAIGGIPILYVVLRNAWRERHWKLLGWLAFPLIAVVVLVGYSLLASGVWTQRAIPSTLDAPFTPLALVLQLVFFLLLCATIAGSTIAVSFAVTKSHFSERLLRFALIPAAVVTLGIVLGLIATGILASFIFSEAPQLASPPTMLVVVIMMLVAVGLSGNALWRGMRAARSLSA